IHTIASQILLPRNKIIDMELIENKSTTEQIPVTPHTGEFKPKGAVAFFLVLILIGLIIWFGIYFIMLARA
ncbi:MAG TPA: cytochrome c oxidase subunit 2A, partial [Chitinophagaceae bacterium]